MQLLLIKHIKKQINVKSAAVKKNTVNPPSIANAIIGKPGRDKTTSESIRVIKIVNTKNKANSQKHLVKVGEALPLAINIANTIVIMASTAAIPNIKAKPVKPIRPGKKAIKRPAMTPAIKLINNVKHLQIHVSLDVHTNKTSC